MALSLSSAAGFENYKAPWCFLVKKHRSPTGRLLKVVFSGASSTSLKMKLLVSLPRASKTTI